MPQGLHDELPRVSVEIQPGATPVLGAGERARMLIGSFAGAIKDEVDELQGTTNSEAADERSRRTRARRARLRNTLEHEATQIVMLGVLGVNLVCLMLQLLTDCHISVADDDPTCIDDLLHIVSSLIVVAFSIETALLVYSLQHAFFEIPLYIVDLCCVSAAVLFLVMFSTDACSLLLISRIWRVAPLIVRHFDLQQGLDELVQREVSAATRAIEEKHASEKTILQNRIAALESAQPRSVLQPVLGGGDARTRGDAVSMAAAPPAKGGQPLV